MRAMDEDVRRIVRESYGSISSSQLCSRLYELNPKYKVYVKNVGGISRWASEASDLCQLRNGKIECRSIAQNFGTLASRLAPRGRTAERPLGRPGSMSNVQPASHTASASSGRATAPVSMRDFKLKPWSEKQKEYQQALSDDRKQVVICFGAPGAGKVSDGLAWKHGSYASVSICRVWTERVAGWPLWLCVSATDIPGP